MSRKIDYELIYDIVRQVPMGRVTTYGAIAEAIGVKGAARIIGYAMNLSHHVLPAVPAHRVVNRIGLLTGRHHFETETEMQTLLEAEGVEIIDNQVIHFKTLFWDPKEHLGVF